MNITLKPDTQERIDKRVESGEFESSDAVVEQAIALFLEYDEGQVNEETRAAVEEAQSQAERGEGISLADFDQRMRAKHGISR